MKMKILPPQMFVGEDSMLCIAQQRMEMYGAKKSCLGRNFHFHAWNIYFHEWSFYFHAWTFYFHAWNFYFHAWNFYFHAWNFYFHACYFHATIFHAWNFFTGTLIAIFIAACHLLPRRRLLWRYIWLLFSLDIFAHIGKRAYLHLHDFLCQPCSSRPHSLTQVITSKNT